MTMANDLEYTINDSQNDTYWQLVQGLFTPKYEGLSFFAKGLYGVFKSKMQLSALPEHRAQFTDKDGKTFFYYKQKNLAEMLQVSEKTISRAMRALVEYGLIRLERHTKSYRIYLRRVTQEKSAENTNEKIVDKKSGKLPDKMSDEMPSQQTNCPLYKRDKNLDNRESKRSGDATGNSLSDGIADTEKNFSSVSETRREKTKAVSWTHNLSSSTRERATAQPEPPSLEDITTFVLEHDLNVDPEQFYNYLSLGTTGFTANWKQRVLSWSANERRDLRTVRRNKENQVVKQNAEYTEEDDAYFAAMAERAARGERV